MKFITIFTVCNLAYLATCQFPGSFASDATNLFNDVKNKVGNTVSDGKRLFNI